MGGLASHLKLFNTVASLPRSAMNKTKQATLLRRFKVWVRLQVLGS
jgi:hypothetical protein